jgi:hypothetical protein
MADDFCVPVVCSHHLPWAREVPFQTFHPLSRFLSLSNNLGNPPLCIPLFATAERPLESICPVIVFAFCRCAV